MSEVRFEIFDAALNMRKNNNVWATLNLADSVDFNSFHYLILKGHWYFGEENYVVYSGTRYVYKFTDSFLDKYQKLKETKHTSAE